MQKTLSFFRLIGVGICLTSSYQSPAITSSPEILVEAPPLNRDPEVTSSHTILKRQIEQQQLTFVDQSFTAIPGVEIVRSGSPGRQINISLRGAKTNHTLILLNGIPLNNPAGNGAFDFGHLMIEDIERIEVLPGSQSLIYGSSAIGGVIRITTTQGSNRPQATSQFEAGNYDTQRLSIGFQGLQDPIRYNVAISKYHTGSGTLKTSKQRNVQGDDYGQQKASARLGGFITPFWDVESYLSKSETELAIDSIRASPLPKKADKENKTQQLIGNLKSTLNLCQDRWEQTLMLSRVKTDTTNLDRSQKTLSTEAYSDRLRYETSFFFNKHNVTTLGGEHLMNRVKSLTFEKSQRISTKSLFGQHKIEPLQDLILGFGARADKNASVNSHFTYKIGSTYRWNKTTFKTSYGTGFRAPSSTEVYGIGSFGIANLSLRSEQSKSFDIGVEHSLYKDKILLEVTYFHLNIHNLIDARRIGGKYQSVNIDLRRSKGVESSLAFKISQNIDFNFGHTFTKAKDSQQRQFPIRLAKHKASIGISYHPSEKAFIFTDVIFVDKRSDHDFSTTPPRLVKLSSYALFNLGSHYQIAQHLKVFGRIENFFNRKYETVFGYGQRGLSVLAGISLKT
ncbi:MAG: TonB-dependent receptor [Alphaproteobacteria bacterium]|nr:TonB-dependent receptor [Alphaproteobacteria bacterium]